jgi:hypothetical protein
MWRRIYDPNLEPAHWSEAIRPGQYAVFVFDARTHVARDAAGRYPDRGEASVAFCDDLAAAQTLAGQVVAPHPDLCCEIYDHEGMARAPLEVVYNPAERGRYTGRPLARRKIFWGVALYVCAVPIVVADVVHDFRLIWGYVIGLKLMIIGTVLLVQGMLGLREHKT